MSETRYCPNCGQPVKAGVAVCDHCGHRLTPAKPAQPSNDDIPRVQRPQPNPLRDRAASQAKKAASARPASSASAAGSATGAGFASAAGARSATSVTEAETPRVTRAAAKSSAAGASRSTAPQSSTMPTSTSTNSASTSSAATSSAATSQAPSRRSSAKSSTATRSRRASRFAASAAAPQSAGSQAAVSASAAASQATATEKAPESAGITSRSVRRHQEATRQPLGKRKKTAWISVAILILLLLFGCWYYSSAHQLSRFVSRVSQGEDVSSYLTLSNRKGAVTESEAKAFVKTVNKNSSALSSMKSAFANGNSYSGLKWVKSGRHLLIFPAYKVKATGAYAKLTTNHAQVTLYRGSTKLDTTSSATTVTKNGPIFPGTYTFKASGKVNGKRVTTKKTVTLAPGTTTSVSLNLKGTSSTTSSADLISKSKAKILLSTAFTGLVDGSNSTVAKKFVNGTSNSSYTELIDFYEALTNLTKVQVVQVKSVTAVNKKTAQITYSVRFTFNHSGTRKVQQFTYHGGEITKTSDGYKIKSIGKTGTSADWEKTYD